MNDCKRLAKLSAGPCNRLWKDECCNARKKDLASYTDLMSCVEQGFDGSVLVTN